MTDPTDKPRVFCKDCRHLSREMHIAGIGRVFYTRGKHCAAAPMVMIDPVDGPKSARHLARHRNAALDCPLFEPIPPPEPPPRPWWRFWGER